MLFRVLQVPCCYEVGVYQVNKVQIIEGDLIRLKIPVEDRFATVKKRILICIFWVKHGNRYVLKCQCGIFHGLWRSYKEYGPSCCHYFASNTTIRERQSSRTQKLPPAMIPPVQQWISPDRNRPVQSRSSPRNFWTGIGPIPDADRLDWAWSVLIPYGVQG